MYSTQKIADFIVNASFDDLPAEVVSKVKLCIMDSIGCMLGGSKTKVGEIVIKATQELGRDGGSTVVGGGSKTSPPNAAFVNSTLANILDFDDTLGGFAHPGATIIPPALAVGETLKVSGKELITACLVGYEVSCRIGVAVQPSMQQLQIIRGLGTWQTFGAAAAVSRLLGLSKDKIVNALGIAGANAPVPSLRKTCLGSLGASNMVKNNYGFASEVAVRSSLLAEKGFTGPPDILDGDDGFWRMVGSDQCDFGRIVQGLGESYRVSDISFKPYPSCRWTHTVIDAVMASKRKCDISGEDIEAIVVRTRKGSTKLPFTDVEPKTMYEAQFSIPYVVAISVAGIPAGPAWYADEQLSKPEIKSLARKVKVEADAEADRLSQIGRMLATVEIVAKGQRYVERVELPKGDPENPLSEEELEGKFRSLATEVLPTNGAEEILRLIQELDYVATVSKIAQLLSEAPTV